MSTESKLFPLSSLEAQGRVMFCLTSDPKPKDTNIWTTFPEDYKNLQTIKKLEAVNFTEPF